MNKFWVACLFLIVSCLPGVASAEPWLVTAENNQDGTRTVQLKEGCEGVYELMKSSVIAGEDGLESPIFRGVAEQFVKDFNEPSQGEIRKLEYKLTNKGQAVILWVGEEKVILDVKKGNLSQEEVELTDQEEAEVEEIEEGLLEAYLEIQDEKVIASFANWAKTRRTIEP